MVWYIIPMNLSELIKQKPYEQVLYKLHRHPLTFIPIVTLYLVLMTMPVIVYLLIDNLYPLLIQSTVLYPLAVLFASIYYLSIYLFFYARFIDYYLDLWIVTNDRIVDIEQHGLFHRVTTELDLFRIQDVTADIKGVFPTIFRYGNVHVKTASSTTSIIFKNVSNPDHIREELVRLADEDRKFHNVKA